MIAAVAVAALLAGAGGVGMAMRDEDPGREAAAPPKSPAPKPGIEVDVTKIGGRPNIVLGAGGHVWAGRFLSERMVALDPADGTRLDSPRPEIDIGLNGLAVSGRDLWALNSRQRELLHLDAATGRPKAEPVPLPGAAGAVVATPDTVYVAVTQRELDPGDQILEFDARTGALRRTIDVRDGVRRLALARGRLWLLASAPAELIGHRPRAPERPHPRGPRVEHRGRPHRRAAVSCGRPSSTPTRWRGSASKVAGRPSSRPGAGRPASWCATASCGSSTARRARSRAIDVAQGRPDRRRDPACR